MKPIAIIGMSSIFPQAENLTRYWDNILGEIDCISEVPASRWEIKDYYDPNPNTPDKTYCKRGGFIPDINFDPAEFGLPPNILEITDVSQLLALVVAKECLEDGGYGESRGLSRENMGVILGMVGVGSKLMIPLTARLQYPVWDKVLQSYGISETDRLAIIEKIKLAYPKWEENSFPGSIGNVVAGRIANRFDLGGTNCVVDAACASSLAAIRMAIGELVEGRADMMISGGVDTDNSIGAFLCFSKTPAFTKGETVRPFDKDSGGMMVGEGIGMVLLKRLEDAQRDGDRIYAVIKGVGTSSDGRFKSIYAPRPEGQSLAIRRAYADAGFSPKTVGLMEAHGTGTMAGDPAEFQGMNVVFSEDDLEKQHIALGSVKSQIGHTKAAAGVASMIKVALSLYHKVLPATINVTEPNPKLGIENTPFYLNTRLKPWFTSENYPRRGAVSSFGFGGTNFHVVLEENEPEHSGAYRRQSTPKMILISAPDANALVGECNKWIDQLTDEAVHESFSELALMSINHAIPADHARVGFTAINTSEALTKLKTSVELLKSSASKEFAESPTGVYYRKNGADFKGKVVALFPGQGSQYINMGSEATINFPEIRQTFAEMDSLFFKDGLTVLSNTVFPIAAFNTALIDEQNRKITATEYAQPAIGTLSAGFYKILQKAGFKADFTAGHSFGELTALWAAGVYSDEDFYFLAKSRGKAMAPLSEPGFDAGTMLAVKGDLEKIKIEIKAFPEIVLANRNSNTQVVLAGPKAAISDVQKLLVGKGFSVVALDVSAAFHTPLVAHAQKPFAAAIQKVKFTKPAIPVFSNTTGKRYPSDPAEIQKILAEHILNPVNFKDEIESIYAAGGSIFIEFGPKNVLTNLVKNILQDKPHAAIALNPNPKKDSDQQLREAVTQLCVMGMELQSFDPYCLPESKPLAKKSSISVQLNGGLYLSEKTRTAFQNAINQQNMLDLNNTNHLQQNSAIKEKEISPITSKEYSVFIQQPVPNNPGTGMEFHTIQEETLIIHKKFLENDAEYTRLFGQLTQQELGLISSNSTKTSLEQINIALQTLDRSMEQFHKHQAETLRIHEQYLGAQVELLKNVIGISKFKSGESDFILPNVVSQKTSNAEANPERTFQNSATSSTTVPGGNGRKSELQDIPVRSVPAKEIVNPSIMVDIDNLTHELLKIVAEKTGYPTEMLDLTMDMEADLGIDSIKRVEILGAMQSNFPDLPKADTTQLAEMHTLGQIVAYMSASTDTHKKPSEPLQPELQTIEVEEVKQQTQKEVGSAVFSLQEIKQALLEIVSEKTGYPAEMLEMNMDMEADLGIDSIKRVEILGAMQERFPDLPKVDASILSEMKTLGQISDYMSSENAGIGHNVGNVNSTIPASESEVETKSQTATLLISDEPPKPDIIRREISLKSLPLPDQLKIDIPTHNLALVVDDGSGLTIKLVEKLISLGIKVAVLSIPQTPILRKLVLPESVEKVALDDISEDSIQSTLKKIEKAFGPIGIFIHLDPAEDGKAEFSENEKKIVKIVFLLAKHLKENLTLAAQNGYAAFLTVTHLDGQFGLSMRGLAEPLSGGLFGLTKSLNLEWEDVFCRAIDVDPNLDSEMAASFIAAELFDPNRLISEVAYNKNGRFTLEVHLPETEVQA